MSAAAETAREKTVEAMVAAVLARAEGDVGPIRPRDMIHLVEVQRRALEILAGDLLDALGDVSPGYARWPAAQQQAVGKAHG